MTISKSIYPTFYIANKNNSSLVVIIETFLSIIKFTFTLSISTLSVMINTLFTDLDVQKKFER